MSSQPKFLNMSEAEILSYANRGFLQNNQVVKSSMTNKKYRIIHNNKMPQSFEELFEGKQNKFALQELNKH